MRRASTDILKKRGQVVLDAWTRKTGVRKSVADSFDYFLTPFINSFKWERWGPILHRYRPLIHESLPTNKISESHRTKRT